MQCEKSSRSTLKDMISISTKELDLAGRHTPSLMTRKVIPMSDWRLKRDHIKSQMVENVAASAKSTRELTLTVTNFGRLVSGSEDNDYVKSQDSKKSSLSKSKPIEAGKEEDELLVASQKSDAPTSSKKQTIVYEFGHQ